MGDCMNNLNDIYIGIVINRKNTHLAICTDKNDYNVVDFSGGYGKKYFSSVVHYNYSEREFLFGNNAVLNDIYEDTYTFSSILEILYSDNTVLEIENEKIEVSYILSLFLGEIFNHINDINPNYNALKIFLCYEHINNYDKNNLFLEAFNLININSNKIYFLLEKDAIYSEVIKDNKGTLENATILFLDSYKSEVFLLENLCDNKYKENVLTINDFSLSLFEKNIFSMLADIYSEKISGKNISESDSWKISKMVYQNFDLLVSKYLNKQNSKVYFNFCYPPFEAKITYELMDKYLKDDIDNIKRKVLTISENGQKPLYIFYEKGFDVLINEIFKNTQFFHRDILKSVTTNFLDDEYNFEITSLNANKQDIGFFIKIDDDEKFYPIIKKGDVKTKIYDTIYLYYLPKFGENIDIVRNLDGIYESVITINLDSLNISDITMIKLDVKFIDDNNVSFIVSNFSDNLEFIFNINEV